MNDMRRLMVFNEYKSNVNDVDESNIRECFIDLFDSYLVEFAEYTEFYFLAVLIKDEEDFAKMGDYFDTRNAVIEHMNSSLDKLKLVYGSISYKINPVVAELTKVYNLIERDDVTGEVEARTPFQQRLDGILAQKNKKD